MTAMSAHLLLLPPPRRVTPQSFEFLVDVHKFKALDRSDAEGIGVEESLEFSRFLDIVNGYIKYDSHSEINIGSDLKHDIMDYTNFLAYRLLSPVSQAIVEVLAIAPEVTAWACSAPRTHIELFPAH